MNDLDMRILVWRKLQSLSEKPELVILAGAGSVHELDRVNNQEQAKFYVEPGDVVRVVVSGSGAFDRDQMFALVWSSTLVEEHHSGDMQCTEWDPERECISRVSGKMGVMRCIPEEMEWGECLEVKQRGCEPGEAWYDRDVLHRNGRIEVSITCIHYRKIITHCCIYGFLAGMQHFIRVNRRTLPKPTKGGMRYIDMACKYKQIHIMEYLLVNHEQVSDFKDPALYALLTSKVNPEVDVMEMVKLLLAHGACTYHVLKRFPEDSPLPEGVSKSAIEYIRTYYDI